MEVTPSDTLKVKPPSSVFLGLLVGGYRASDLQCQDHRSRFHLRRLFLGGCRLGLVPVGTQREQFRNECSACDER
jgi:hypothetical protein